MHGVTFANVVIGVDGRDGGRDAIALAKQLAAPNASLTLAHVDTGGPVSWWAHELGEERAFDREVSVLAAERESAGMDAGIVCVRDASPAAALHDLARTRAADLIVVGSSRRRLLGRVLLGDDARAALDGARIAPRGYRDRAGRHCAATLRLAEAGGGRRHSSGRHRGRSSPAPAGT